MTPVKFLRVLALLTYSETLGSLARLFSFTLSAKATLERIILLVDTISAATERGV